EGGRRPGTGDRGDEGRRSPAGRAGQGAARRAEGGAERGRGPEAVRGRTRRHAEGGEAGQPHGDARRDQGDGDLADHGGRAGGQVRRVHDPPGHGQGAADRRGERGPLARGQDDRRRDAQGRQGLPVGRGRDGGGQQGAAEA